MYTFFCIHFLRVVHALTSLFTIFFFYYLPSFLEMYTMYTLFLGVEGYVYKKQKQKKRNTNIISESPRSKKSVYIVYISKKLGK